MLAARVLGISLAALAAFVACGGNSSDHDGNGTSGTGGTSGSPAGGSAGTGGSAGSATSGSSGASGKGGTTSSGGSTTGGSAGTTTSGGSAGTAATGGNAGTAPTGGTAGTATGGSGGSGGGGRECETAADCRLFTDCCNCEAVPIGADIPGCDLVCITDHCSAQQIRSDEVACSFGRCVIDRSCDQNRITCTTDPEPCPSGLVHSVDEAGCYGACLPPTDCRDVTDCASCSDGDVCVIEEPRVRTFGCVRRDASCRQGNYCECLDPCPTSGFECLEQSDAVHCPCPVC